MDPLEPPTTSHPLVTVLDRVQKQLIDAAQVPTWTLDTETTADVVTRLVALESQVAAVKLAALAHASAVDVAGPVGASSTANWLAHATRTTRPEAHRQTRLATALDSEKHQGVREALAQGGLRVEQARVIVTAVDALPGDLDADLATKAAAWLVEQAEFFDAAKLAILGHGLLQVIAPDLADAHEAKRLEAEERRAAQKTRLSMSSDGEGLVFVKARIPDLHAAMLKKILLAFAAPKHRAAVGDADGQARERTPSPERMGKAFCDFLESVTEQQVPATGGTGATVVVTMDLDTLLGGLKAAHLDNGDLVSAATARRLACQAGLIPAVLGGASVPLDLGRRARFHTRSQRIAIALRDGGCTAEGCDWPPGMCHVHHDPAWSEGGVTDIKHARMLCPYHHARAHDPSYDHTTLPDGTIRFHRRT